MKLRIQIILATFAVIFNGYSQVADSLVSEETPYSASEIPANLIQLDLLIEEISNIQKPTEKYLLITDSLDIFQDSLNVVIKKMDTVPTGVALQILEIQKNRISQFSAPLNNWIAFLGSRTAQFESAREEIARYKNKWEVTLSRSTELDSTSSIMSEIKTRLDTLAYVERGMTVRAHEIIEYEVRINRMNQQITQLIDRLDQYLGNSLWARDSAPLWALENDSLSNVHGVQQLKAILIAKKSSLLNYYNLYRPNFTWNLIVFIVILILIIRVRISSRKQQRYEDLEFLYFSLKRPVFSALLLAVICAIWIYTNIPRVMAEIAIILALISVIGILYKYVANPFRMPLIILGLVYLLNYLQFTLPVGTSFQRIVMGAESLVVIAYIIWLINLFRLHKPKIPYGWLKMLVRLLPFALLIVVASTLANLVGSVRLSKFLLTAIIESGSLAVVFFGAVMITSSIIAYLLRTPYAHLFNLIRDNFELMQKRLMQLFQYLGLILWLRSSLIILGLLDDLLEWFREAWAFGITFGNVTVTVGGILGFFLIVLVSWWLARVLQLLLERELFDRLKITKGIPHAISTTIYYIFIGLGFLLAISYAGFDLNQISLVIGALGVGIGFGLQNVISNFVSGLILTFERPINVGDTVEVGQLMGNVSSMGLRSSKVKTFDGSEVIVPNSNLVSKEVINWTLSDNQRRLTIPVSVAYGADPHKVLDIMKEVVANHPKVLGFPNLLTLFDGFGDNSLNFRVLFWVNFSESMVVKSEVAMSIFDSLQQAGIEVPITQRVAMRSDDMVDPDS